MHYTRIYSDEQGDSHFEVVEVPVSPVGMIGALSEQFNVRTLQFRENAPDYNWDFHNAPHRQFIILLTGGIVITTSLGETQVFGAGDILLVEDTTGKGHKTRNTDKQIRKSLIIKL